MEKKIVSWCPHLVRKGLERRPDRVSAAKLGGLEASDNVLQCGSHNKVLLFQAQLLPLKEL